MSPLIIVCPKQGVDFNNAALRFFFVRIALFWECRKSSNKPFEKPELISKFNYLFHNTNLRCILEKIVLPMVNGSSSKRFLKTQGLFPNAYTFIPEDFLRIFVLFLLINEGLARKYSLKPFLLSIVEAYFSTPSMPFNLKAFVSTYSLYDFTQLNMLIQTIC